MIVSRERYNEMLSLKDSIIAEKDSRIANLEQALHRLEDLIFSKNFGVQLYDTVKEDMPEASEAPPEENPEDRERLEIASLKRRRSSKLPEALRKAGIRRYLKDVHAAHPAVQHFEAVKKSVTE